MNIKKVKDGNCLKIDDLMQKIDLNLLNEEMYKTKNQKVELSNRDKKYLLNFYLL